MNTNDLRGLVFPARRYRNRRTGRVVHVIALHADPATTPPTVCVTFRYEGNHERTSCWEISRFVDSFRLIEPRVSALRALEPVAKSLRKDGGAM